MSEHVFDVSMRWVKAASVELASAGLPPLHVSAPAVFGGTGADWTPEDLLCGALESCLMMTALYFVNKQGIALQSCTARTKLAMDKTPAGLRFTGATIVVEAVVGKAEDVSRMEQALRNGEKYCPVSAGVNFPVHLECAVTAAG